MGDSKTLEERVSRIEKIFWVVFIVAAVFGVGGAWGSKMLQDSNSQLASINKSIKNMTALVSEQEKNSIKAVKDQEKLSIDDLREEIKNVTDQIQKSIQPTFNKQLTNLTDKIQTKQVLQSMPGKLPVEGEFASNGGTVIVCASGSGSRGSHGLIGMDIKIDGKSRGSSKFYTNRMDIHRNFKTTFVVLDDLSVGPHHVTLDPLEGTNTDEYDFFDVIVIELP